MDDIYPLCQSERMDPSDLLGRRCAVHLYNHPRPPTRPQESTIEQNLFRETLQQQLIQEPAQQQGRKNTASHLFNPVLCPACLFPSPNSSAKPPEAGLVLTNRTLSIQCISICDRVTCLPPSTPAHDLMSNLLFRKHPGERSGIRGGGCLVCTASCQMGAGRVVANRGGFPGTSAGDGVLLSPTLGGSVQLGANATTY